MCKETYKIINYVKNRKNFAVSHFELDVIRSNLIYSFLTFQNTYLLQGSTINFTAITFVRNSLYVKWYACYQRKHYNNSLLLVE